MTTLLDRLEKATADSRRLDAEVFAWLNGLIVADTWAVADSIQFRVPGEKGARYVKDDDLPAYTDSLDAVLGLVEEKRSEMKCYLWRVWLDDEPVHNPYYAELAFATGSPVRERHPRGIIQVDGPTAALALLKALVQALERG